MIVLQYLGPRAARREQQRQAPALSPAPKSPWEVRAHAEPDPLGAAASWRIEYAGEAEAAKLGTAEAKTAGEGTLAAGFATVDVSAHPQTGLLAATTYQYRFVAEDEREGVRYVFRGSEGTFTTQGEGETLEVGGLPDDRAWELVSPSDRHGTSIQPLNGWGPVQAAAAGGAIEPPRESWRPDLLRGWADAKDEQAVSCGGA